MAVDTEAKRMSLLGFGGEDLLPIPDGSIDQADRQTLLGLYGGILAESAVVPVPGNTWTPEEPLRTWRV
jgi:hypothetical protein